MNAIKNSTEKIIILKVLEKIPKIFSHIYAIVLILGSWVIFAFEDLLKVKDYFMTIFHMNGTSFVNNEALYYLNNYFIIILIGIILSTPLIKNILDRFEKKNTVTTNVLISVIYLSIFLLSTASLVSDTYNPFLYFRF